MRWFKHLTAWLGQRLLQLIILERSHLAPIFLVKLLMKRIKRKMHPTNCPTDSHKKLLLSIDAMWRANCCLNVGALQSFIIMWVTWLGYSIRTFFSISRDFSVFALFLETYFIMFYPLNGALAHFTWFKYFDGRKFIVLTSLRSVASPLVKKKAKYPKHK